ncbi:uncharacterized protein LOC111485591 isoform X1 [Cucurbita maxima]|uniref:Uncharacterized protein LOC111485591 isoform X1 n=1 Tax=Cucurbita maxima TaxID=3661 RepID=A0A6J1JLX5_CUCMA|nr:uncharacterized protein LOC111485591 isoform X1 [Cucurbita maxima]
MIILLLAALSLSGMGTRLEPTFKPLPNSAHTTNTFIVRRVHDWHHFQGSTTRLPHKFYTSAMTGSLDKMLQKGDVDAIRKTMQGHEDVFKNQVKELHRLYSVQKMLMEEVRRKSMNHLQFKNRENQTEQSSGGGLILKLQSFRSDDPSSGSCSGDNMRIMSRGFDLERPAEEDMSTGVSAVDEDRAGPSKMNTGDGCEEEDSDVELTLSIGGSVRKKRSKSERGEECSDPSTPMSSSSGTCDQETKRPHWLFQSLKLK